MYDLETIGVILGIFVLWGCFKLYEEFLWFRVVAATFGIGLTLLVPIGSLVIAYISFFEEDLWLVASQVLLGWSIGGIAFWYSIGTYLKFMKDTFGKTKNNLTPSAEPINKKDEDIVSIDTIKDFNGMKIAMGKLKDGSGHVVVYDVKLNKWVKSGSVSVADVVRCPPWIENEN